MKIKISPIGIILIDYVVKENNQYKKSRYHQENKKLPR